MDWVGVLANAVSLAVGVASGSLLSYFLLKKEAKSMIRELTETEVYQRFNTILRELNELLGSEEAKRFISNLNKIVSNLLKTSDGELIKLPELDKNKNS